MGLFSKLLKKEAQANKNDDLIKAKIAQKLKDYKPHQQGQASFKGPQLSHLNINPDDTINWSMSGIQRIPTLRNVADHR